MMPRRIERMEREALVGPIGKQIDVIDILVNHAGRMRVQPLLEPGTAELACAEMEVNYFGTLSMSRAFAPVVTPQEVALRTLVGIEAGCDEVFGDDISRTFRETLNRDAASVRAEMARLYRESLRRRRRCTGRDSG
jgi:NAD(P)-dependent dehydrogenase (short-subunit alcohol dehydrogenase family)